MKKKETLCWTYGYLHQVETIRVRPFNVYGPGMRQQDQRVLPNFASQLAQGKAPMVYAGGDQTRTFTYATDAMVGFLRAMLVGRAGQAYNIGNPLPEISIRNLARRVVSIAEEILDFPSISPEASDYPESYPGDEPQRRCPDIRKAQRDFNYQPEVSLEEGLRRFLEWAAENYSAEDALTPAGTAG